MHLVEQYFWRPFQTAGGNWSTVYYAIFTDWKSKRRKFPLGSESKSAKETLAIYEARNVNKEDFDEDKASHRRE